MTGDSRAPVDKQATGSRPVATYRVQLTPEFGFDQAASIAGYLADLGISHLYTSPYLQAVPGSTHGYDVVDHTKVNEDLGGEQAHARLLKALEEAGLSQVIDVVPNHMAIGNDRNRWWWDVLENGAASRYARYFDVDWDPPQLKLRHKVLIPVLGDHYGKELEAGRIVVSRQNASFVVSYFEHRMPLAPRSLALILERGSERASNLELESLAAAYERLPDSSKTDAASVHERDRDRQVLNARLAGLLDEMPPLGPVLDAVLRDICADPDDLDRLLERQNWRLAHWRTGAFELDYRRFFDVDHLVALRVDDDAVFEDTHGLVLGWVAEGSVTGLRIDHPDGLTDPQGYLERLARRAPGAWIVVEKILQVHESLPEAWPVAGTTGYDFARPATGLFVDPAAEDAFTDIYREITGESRSWEEVAEAGKQRVVREVLATEVNRLTVLFAKVCERHRRYRDYLRRELAEVLRAALESFGVYRTYVRPSGEAASADVERVTEAIVRAARTRDDLDPELLEFLQDLLLLRVEAQPDPDDGDGRGLVPEVELALRFQQLSAPVMAKGVEDTALYNYNRLVALNEVGADPGVFGTTPKQFHDWCLQVQKSRPSTMLGTSTHDTKRSEDVRARLAVLSEMPELWRSKVLGWIAMNAASRSPLLDRNIEYLLYQTLVGAWPISADRLAAYMEKASREAKAQTSWTEPNAEYDRALSDFVKQILADPEFVSDLEEFTGRLVGPGRINSVAQTLLKLTAPGVPDVYQGCELWDLSLVDPDNRRPVDFEHRRRLLSQLDAMSPEEVMKRSDQGLPKLLVLSRALRLRTRSPESFGAGADYVPLPLEGPHRRHVLAYSRAGSVVAVVPRLVAGRPEGWGRARVAIPDGRWLNVLTGDTDTGGWRPAGQILQRFPVALLHRLE
ncbi:MAG: malto-oligosyltrehalose synthase [Actinomycetota bacterium]